MFNGQSRSPHDAKNSLLPLELRLNAFDAASATMHAAKAIPLRIALYDALCREGSGVEKGDELSDSRGASGKGLARIFRSSTPLVRLKL